MLPSVGDKSAFAGICTLSEYFPCGRLWSWRWWRRTRIILIIIIIIWRVVITGATSIWIRPTSSDPRLSCTIAATWRRDAGIFLECSLRDAEAKQRIVLTAAANTAIVNEYVSGTDHYPQMPRWRVARALTKLLLERRSDFSQPRVVYYGGFSQESRTPRNTLLPRSFSSIYSSLCALADSPSDFGLPREQRSPKCENPCLGRRWTAVQNVTPLALSSAEKSVTVQTNKQKNKNTEWKTVTDMSTSCLSACMDNKHVVLITVGSKCIYIYCGASHAALWWVTINMPTRQTNERTDGQAVTYRFPLEATSEVTRNPFQSYVHPLPSVYDVIQIRSLRDTWPWLLTWWPSDLQLALRVTSRGNRWHI